LKLKIKIELNFKAVRAAISKAFKTPEVVAVFASQEPVLLRQELAQVEANYRLHKIEKEVYEMRKLEILAALSKLGDQLTVEEQYFLNKLRMAPVSKFQEVSSDTSCKETTVNDMLR
uniref:Protein LZIC n=1 Tax=Syphacia muris TaxID=451379 RepID=A0A0N5AKC0_9BILA